MFDHRKEKMAELNIYAYNGSLHLLQRWHHGGSSFYLCAMSVQDDKVILEQGQ